MYRASIATLALVLAMNPLIGVQASAQEAPKPAEAPSPANQAADTKPTASKPPVLLRVQLVVARYQGDKKVGSVPYSFLVTSEEKSAKVRMGVEVPVPVTIFSKADGDKASPVTSYTYRNVGTNIDCRAQERGAGLFVLHLNIESSSVYSTSGGSPLPSTEMPMASDKPFFRTFNVSLDPVLRDGQSVQAVASTDPVTGEVVKIDVTLNVVK